MIDDTETPDRDSCPLAEERTASPELTLLAHFFVYSILLTLFFSDIARQSFLYFEALFLFFFNVIDRAVHFSLLTGLTEKGLVMLTSRTL